MADAHPDYTNMTPGDLLRVLGDDASKWATAFCQIIERKEIVIDEAFMLGWFANAIEYSSDVRRWKREAEDNG